VSSAWAPGRRPSPRGDRTRSAILAAATERFAADGYDRTTLRAVAADAQTDAALIIRHFGSKAGLFAAAVQIGLTPVDLAGLPPAEAGRELARSTFLPWEQGQTRAQEILLRTAPTHPEAAAGVQAILDQQLTPAVAAILSSDPAARTRAGLIQSHGIGVVMTRYLLRIEPMASMDFGQLVESTGAFFEQCLTVPAGTRPQR
jgi:AcrR family transcriptional regulator